MSFMQAWSYFFERATDAPAAYGIGSGLMALSTISLGRLKLDNGQRGINSNLYMMLTGPSSIARKSTSVQFAQTAVETLEPSYVGPRDYTMEALASWMATSVAPGHHQAHSTKRNRVCLFAEEFGADLAKRSQYNASFDTEFCHLYDGSSTEKIRADSRKSVRVDSPRVNIFAACAHTFLERYLSYDDWMSGFLLRFLYVEPTALRPRFASQPTFPHAEWGEAMRNLQWIKQALDYRSGLGLIPGSGLSPEARAVYESYTDWLASQVKEDGPPKNYLGRFFHSVLKCALLAQLNIEPQSLVVSYAAMMDAVKWSADIFWPSFLSVFKLTTQNDPKSLKSRLAAFIAQNPNVPVGVVGKTFLNAYRVDAAIRELVSMQVVDLVPMGDGTRVLRLRPETPQDRTPGLGHGPGPGLGHGHGPARAASLES